MKISQLYQNKPVVSLEIFPPKPDKPLSTIFDTIEDLSPLKPDFISVTYGAGGNSRAHTVKIADALKNKYQIETLAHLTCFDSTEEELDTILDELSAKNIENVLALRGDPPADSNDAINKSTFVHASDLIRHIRTTKDLCIGAACYPEGHVENISRISDLRNLQVKVNEGTDFLITQLFFDNDMFYAFIEKLQVMGITTPVSAGIMPVLGKAQIERMTKLCGASITPKFQRILDRYEHNPEALKEAGIAYATEQIIDLLSYGVDGIHLYTMNKAEIAAKILNDISCIRDHLNNQQH